MRLDGFPSLTDGFVEFIEFMVFFLQDNEDDVDGGGSEERMRLFVNRSFDSLLLILSSCYMSIILSDYAFLFGF